MKLGLDFKMQMAKFGLDFVIQMAKLGKQQNGKLWNYNYYKWRN